MGERRDAIERTLVLPVSPERVWAAITEPAQLSRWFGEEAVFELKPGAEGSFGWGGDERFRMRVVAVEPPRRFAYHWHHQRATDPTIPFDRFPHTLVDFVLTGVEGGTELRLTESGFAAFEEPDYSKCLADNEGGWTDELGHLELLLREDR